MAAAVTTALALCALLAGASARGRSGYGDDHCTSVTVGSEYGRPVVLPPADLPAGVPNTKAEIPAEQACYPYEPVGYQLMACDPDGPPPPKVFPHQPSPPYEAIIERNPPALSTGKLFVTVFCSGPYGYAPPAGGVGGGQVEARELVAGGGGRGRKGVAVVPYV